MRTHFIIFVCICFFPVQAFAMKTEVMENVPADNSFPVGPTSFSIDASPGDSIIKTIQIDNRFGRSKNFSISVEDFQGSESDPAQTVLLQGEKSGRYSAKDWITLESTGFTSNHHGERTRMNVTVRIPENADPGDHYASVIVSADPDAVQDQENLGEANVRIISRVGILFFIRVLGNIEEKGQLQSFESVSRWYWEQPVNFNIVYKNSGTVRTRPFGEVRITNIFGSVSGVIYVDPYTVLRNSIRGMKYEWHPENLPFGRYAATLKLYNGYNGLFEEKQIFFWIFPWKQCGVGILLAVSVFALIRFFRKNFEVKRK